jgi:DNA-binding GntR family transcriptional regulator
MPPAARANQLALPAAPARPCAGAVQQAAQAIRDMVERGVLVPGQRLVEPDLVAQLGVSRATLREAFRVLDTEGLVKLERYKGASVRRLEGSQVLESFEIRELLEGLAARRAAGLLARKGPLRSRLLALAEAMEKAAARRAVREYGALNREFHQLVVAAADSQQLEALAAYLHPPTILHILHGRLTELGAMDRSMAEHRVVIQALLAGDGEKAEAAMRRHVRSSMKEVVAMVGGA